MSETLSESLNKKKTVTTIAATSSVGHSEIPVAENTPKPLLTASQEEHILNELSKSNTQQTTALTTALTTFRVNFQRLC